MTKCKRVFILGIDGASWNVLDPQLAAGRMPCLQSWLDRGVRADLESVVPPVTPAAWSSFHTGKQPGKHGVMDFRGYDARSGRLRFNSTKQIRSRTFWQVLSDHGRRVGVVHVPMTYPPRAVNGVVVSGFETPSVDSAFCYPPELRNRVMSWFPDYLFGVDRATQNTAADIAAMFEAGRKGLMQRAELVERLHKDDRFDVFMVNFQELDHLLHRVYLYAVHDDDPLADPGLVAETQSLIETLDTCIGRVLASGRSYDVQLMVSDHGFTREIGKVHPNAALEAWGYFVRHSSEERGPTDPARRLLSGMERSSFRAARALAGAVRGWRRSTRAWVVGQQMASATDLDFDLARTRAAVVASDMSGLLYINRHSSGPFADASAQKIGEFRRELAGRFRALQNELTKTPLFRTVLDMKVAGNSEDSTLPDLILVPDEGIRAVSGFSGSRFAPMVIFVGMLDSTGTHRPAGLLAAAGSIACRHTITRECRLIDMAPTILTLAGAPVPNDMDGAVIEEIAGDAALVSGPSIIEPAVLEHESATGPYSDNEQKAVEERLRSLGYLE